MGERSTKRQKELLDFIDKFIAEHGYAPSYREVMSALGYKSVSTVAIHIDGLITKGYLRKRDHSARSLEVVTTSFTANGGVLSGATPAREKWLVGVITEKFREYKGGQTQQGLDELYVLIGALKVLGFDGAYEAMRARLAEVVKR